MRKAAFICAIVLVFLCNALIIGGLHCDVHAQEAPADIFYPGKKVWVEYGGWLTPKGEIESVNGDGGFRVRIFAHDRSLDNVLGAAQIDTITVTREELEKWNRPRYTAWVRYQGLLTPKAEVIERAGPNSLRVKVYRKDGSTDLIETDETEFKSLNRATYPQEAQIVSGIRMDFDDPDVRRVIEEGKRIVAEHLPGIRSASNNYVKADRQRELTRALYTYYKSLGMEHDRNIPPDDPYPLSARRARLSRDGYTLGGYLRAKVGTCTYQAPLFWSLFNKWGAPEEAGIPIRILRSGIHSVVWTSYADGSRYATDLTSGGENGFETHAQAALKPFEVVFQGGTTGHGYMERFADIPGPGRTYDGSNLVMMNTGRRPLGRASSSPDFMPDSRVPERLKIANTSFWSKPSSGRDSFVIIMIKSLARNIGNLFRGLSSRASRLFDFFHRRDREMSPLRLIREPEPKGMLDRLSETLERRKVIRMRWTMRARR